MIVKNLINFVDLVNFLGIFSLLYLINNFIFNINIRKKFFLLVIILFLTVFIGLYYNLDGIIMIFFISELSVILIFIALFSQLYTYEKNVKKNVNVIIFTIILTLLNIEFYNTNFLLYNNFYSWYSININDFYYIYNFFFEKQIFTTILTTIILTIYSVFFILVYFKLKKLQNYEHSKVKNLILLRKQNIINQANYKTKLRIFK